LPKLLRKEYAKRRNAGLFCVTAFLQIGYVAAFGFGSLWRACGANLAAVSDRVELEKRANLTGMQLFKTDHVVYFLAELLDTSRSGGYKKSLNL